MSIVAMATMYTSVQRPSAIVNCTMDEYSTGNDNDGVFVIKVNSILYQTRC